MVLVAVLARAAHALGKRAAELAGILRVLEATMPRALLRCVGDLYRMMRLPAPYSTDDLAPAYAPRATITHRINVCRFARHKRDAFAAHRSQIGSGLIARLFGTLLRLPPQAFGLIFSHEWFVDPTAAPKARCRAIFD